MDGVKTVALNLLNQRCNKTYLFCNKTKNHRKFREVLLRLKQKGDPHEIQLHMEKQSIIF